MKITKRSPLFVCSLVILTMICSASAQEEEVSPGKKNAKNVAGTVSQLTDTAITVKNPKTGERTLEITSATQIVKADGSPGTVEDLKSAKRVRATTDATGKIVETITIAGGGKGGGKGGKPETETPQE